MLFLHYALIEQISNSTRERVESITIESTSFSAPSGCIPINVDHCDHSDIQENRQTAISLDSQAGHDLAPEMSDHNTNSTTQLIAN